MSFAHRLAFFAIVCPTLCRLWPLEGDHALRRSRNVGNESEGELNPKIQFPSFPGRQEGCSLTHDVAGILAREPGDQAQRRLLFGKRWVVW
jgi:hypothetical protein